MRSDSMMASLIQGWLIASTVRAPESSIIMKQHTRLSAILLPAVAVLIVGCTKSEISAEQRGSDTVPTPGVAASTATSQVNSPSDSSATGETQPTARVDTLPTPDRSQWRPKMPMVLAGSCPGEDCTYGNLVIACEGLRLVATDSAGAKQTGVRIHKGDTVTLATGNFHLMEPGTVLIQRDYIVTDYSDIDTGASGPRPDTLRFFAGDTLYVLDYLELGGWKWSYRGRVGASEEFWTGPLQRVRGPGRDKLPAISVSSPRGEWWYKLQVDTADEGGWIRVAAGWWRDKKFVAIDSDWKC